MVDFRESVVYIGRDPLLEMNERYRASTWSLKNQGNHHTTAVRCVYLGICSNTLLIFTKIMFIWLFSDGRSCNLSTSDHLLFFTLGDKREQEYTIISFTMDIPQHITWILIVQYSHYRRIYTE